MRRNFLVALTTLVLGLFIIAWPGRAVAQDFPCPDIGHASECNLVITVNPDGSITLSTPDANPFDGVEDQLIGVVNNGTATITSLFLSGSGIFGFDGDGLCSGFDSNTSTPYTDGSFQPIPSGCPFDDGLGNQFDATYAGQINGKTGQNEDFDIVDLNTGVVNFRNGGILSGGGSAYFSLEEPASVTGLTTITVNGTVPEPASLLLMGTGLLGLASRIRRRRNKV